MIGTRAGRTNRPDVRNNGANACPGCRMSGKGTYVLGNSAHTLTVGMGRVSLQQHIDPTTRGEESPHLTVTLEAAKVAIDE